MRYDIIDHSLLSPDAAALSAEALEAEANVAELILGIADSDYRDQYAERAALAVALQVNYQVALDPAAAALSSWSMAGRGEVFRFMGVPEVNPVAAKIVAGLPQAGAADQTVIHDAWQNVRTLRPLSQ